MNATRSRADRDVQLEECDEALPIVLTMRRQFAASSHRIREVEHCLYLAILNFATSLFRFLSPEKGCHLIVTLHLVIIEDACLRGLRTR